MSVKLSPYLGPRGAASPKAKLSDLSVEAIRLEYERFPIGHPEHVGLKRLARRYCVSRAQVQRIVRYQQR